MIGGIINFDKNVRFMSFYAKTIVKYISKEHTNSRFATHNYENGGNE